MGLAVCPRASFAWVASGREWKALLRLDRKCAWNGAGGYRPALAIGLPIDKNSEKWAYVLQAEMAYGLKAYSLEGMDTLHYSRPFTGGALKVKRVTSSDDGTVEDPEETDRRAHV